MVLPELKELMVLSSSRSHKEQSQFCIGANYPFLEKFWEVRRLEKVAGLQVQRDLEDCESIAVRFQARIYYWKAACCCRLFLLVLGVILVLFYFSVSFNTISHVIVLAEGDADFFGSSHFSSRTASSLFMCEGRNPVLGICFQGGLGSTIFLVLYNIYTKYLGMASVLLSCSSQELLSRCFLTAWRDREVHFQINPDKSEWLWLLRSATDSGPPELTASAWGAGNRRPSHNYILCTIFIYAWIGKHSSITHALIISQLEYCNAVYIIGLSLKSIWNL